MIARNWMELMGLFIFNNLKYMWNKERIGFAEVSVILHAIFKVAGMALDLFKFNITSLWKSQNYFCLCVILAYNDSLFKAQPKPA